MTRSLFKTLINLRYYLSSKVCVLFFRLSVKTYDSEAFRNIDMTRERFSFAFDSRDMLLFLHIGFSVARAAVAFAILVKVSDFAHSWFNRWVSFAPEFQLLLFL